MDGGEGILQLAVRGGSRHADPLRFRGDGRLRAHPDDVPDLHIVGEEGLRSGIDVQHGGHHRLVEAHIIQPGAVLAELIAIVLVLGRRLGIADEQDHPALPGLPHPGEQRLPPADIDLFCEHSIFVFVQRYAFLPKSRASALKRLRTESAIERCFRASPALETSGAGTKSASECQKRAALYSVRTPQEIKPHVPACINRTCPLALTALPLALTARTPVPLRPTAFPFWPWRISILLSVASVKAPPEKGRTFPALSIDLQAFICHGRNGESGRPATMGPPVACRRRGRRMIAWSACGPPVERSCAQGRAHAARRHGTVSVSDIRF